MKKIIFCIITICFLLIMIQQSEAFKKYKGVDMKINSHCMKCHVG